MSGTNQLSVLVEYIRSMENKQETKHKYSSVHPTHMNYIGEGRVLYRRERGSPLPAKQSRRGIAKIKIKKVFSWHVYDSLYLIFFPLLLEKSIQHKISNQKRFVWKRMFVSKENDGPCLLARTTPHFGFFHLCRHQLLKPNSLVTVDWLHFEMVSHVFFIIFWRRWRESVLTCLYFLAFKWCQQYFITNVALVTHV